MKPALALALGVEPRPRRISTYARLVQWWRVSAREVADQDARPLRAHARSRWAEYPDEVLDKLAAAGVVRRSTRTPVAIEIWFEGGTPP